MRSLDLQLFDRRRPFFSVDHHVPSCRGLLDISNAPLCLQDLALVLADGDFAWFDSVSRGHELRIHDQLMVVALSALRVEVDLAVALDFDDLLWSLAAARLDQAFLVLCLLLGADFFHVVRFASGLSQSDRV